MSIYMNGGSFITSMNRVIQDVYQADTIELENDDVNLYVTIHSSQYGKQDKLFHFHLAEDRGEVMRNEGATVLDLPASER